MHILCITLNIYAVLGGKGDGVDFWFGQRSRTDLKQKITSQFISLFVSKI